MGGQWRALIRLIPAHAGKTPFAGRSDTRSPAHPRSRGENRKPATCVPVGAGSSPLTRGKRADARPPANRDGLIPAHAGKTEACGAEVNVSQAHPRSRGENEYGFAVADKDAGSSPLTRGKRADDAFCLGDPGLIPAHAGKTCRRWLRIRPRRAHPRSRGENHEHTDMESEMQGSSPLTRGKLALHHLVVDQAGLIPAHAGKTRPCSPPSTTEAAHPRSRGENGSGPTAGNPMYGSSPLTRGKRPCGRIPRRHTRLIPAHAGKTSSGFAGRFVSTAHPRSRGENNLYGIVTERKEGSSPLTRGKRKGPGSRGCVLRLIPAHAGKT